MSENINSYVIYSPNESAVLDDGFWRNGFGWTTFDRATRFSQQDTQTMSLPVSTGADAKWVLWEEANASYGAPVSETVEVGAVERGLQMSKTTVQDPLFIKSEAIKAEYLSSGCQASDVDAAIERLMAECGELFQDNRAAWEFLIMPHDQDDHAAWEFLMEETHEDNEASETVTVRLTLDVTYSLNGENATEMVSRLRKMCERAIGEGMLTGETDAEVEEYSMDALIQPEPLSEDELADFMLQRIENGNLAPEDLPVRLARYGLMEPSAFVDEMRERMELAKDAAASCSARRRDHHIKWLLVTSEA